MANVFVMCPDTLENLNTILIRQQFGEFVEEDYISNYNHLLRKSQLEIQITHEKFENFLDPMSKEFFMEGSSVEIDPPSAEKCQKRIKLKGPYSSLSIEPYGLTESTRNSRIVVDRYSVNSVMLENDPQVSKIIK